MSISQNVLKNDEKAIFKLRELYSRYGYMRYKVSKFEEYDLYAYNKNFLISDNILTFTDTDGKLMALKPDITLSIIKNVGDSDSGTHKLYYNENVYRTSASSDGFKEIVQTGLECIGKIDIQAICEVIVLAKRSLDTISSENILDISHMGFILGFMENLGIEGADADALLEYVGHKNTPAIKRFCEERGVSVADADAICAITGLYAPLERALHSVKPFVRGGKMEAAYDELCSMCHIISELGELDGVYIDFSTVNDMNYYNGVTFKGFVNGIPDSVLSGGRYDSLMKKMGKRAGAIGFAVYLDMLDMLDTDVRKYDVDTVLTYDDGADISRVMKAADELRGNGVNVKIEYGRPENIRYRQLVKVTERGVEVLESND